MHPVTVERAAGDGDQEEETGEASAGREEEQCRIRDIRHAGPPRRTLQRPAASTRPCRARIGWEQVRRAPVVCALRYSFRGYS